jgi:hypothetical protein
MMRDSNILTVAESQHTKREKHSGNMNWATDAA